MLPWIVSFFILGVILLCVEVIIPGFGVPGISGICLLAVGSIMTASSYGTFVLTAVFIFIGIFMLFVIRIIKKRNLYSKIVLEDIRSVKDFDESSISHLMGSVGVTIVPLKPYGKANFDGVTVDVFSDGEYITKNKKVKVIAINGKNVTVREISQV